MDPEKVQAMVDLAHKRGYSDAEIQAKLKSIGVDWSPPAAAAAPQQMQGSGPDAAMDPRAQAAITPGPGGEMGMAGVGGALVQGATMNLAGQMSEAFRKEQEAFAAKHPIVSGAANVAGAVGGAMGLAALSPVALPAGWAARALMGGLQGGVSAAADGEGTLRDRAGRGAVGGALGATLGVVAPGVASRLGRGVHGLMKPFMDKAGTVADAAGPMLGEDAVEQMARRNAVAPGLTVPAQLNPDLPAAVRVLGANAPLAQKAQQESMGRIRAIQVRLREVGDQIESVVKRPDGKPIYAPVEGDVRKVLVKNQLAPDINDHVAVDKVKELRSDIMADVKRSRGKGSIEHHLREDLDKVTKWLYKQVPELEKLDGDYKLLSQMKEESTNVHKNIRQSRKSYTSSSVAGISPDGSPASSIPGKASFMHKLVSPDRSKLAAEAYRQLLTPGSIPMSLLRARAAAALAGQPSSGIGALGAAAGVGRVAAFPSQSLAGLLDQ